MWCINVVVFFLGYRYTALFHHVQYSNMYEIKWAKLKLNITKYPSWTYCRLSLPHSLLSLLTSSIWPANAIFCFTVPLSEKACALENGGSWPLFGISMSCGCCVLIARNGDGWWMRNCKTTVSGCVRSCDRQRQRRERYRTNSTQPAANCSPTSASYYHKTKFTKIKWHSNILFTYMKYIATWWQLNEETTSWQLQEENNESLSLELSSFVSIL